MLDLLKRAYLAGVVDSEGWFSLGRQRTRFQPHIAIETSSSSTATLVARHWGCPVTQREPRGFGKKVVYGVRMRSARMHRDIHDIVGFLTEKAEQAKCVLRYLAVKRAYPRSRNPVVIAAETRLAHRLSKLNHPAWSTGPSPAKSSHPAGEEDSHMATKASLLKKKKAVKTASKGSKKAASKGGKKKAIPAMAY